MTGAILHFFSGFPPAVSVMLMAILPVLERFALPIAVLKYHLPVIEAFVIVVLSNMVPVVLILLLADKFHLWLSKHDSIFGRTWVKSVAHAQAKFQKYEKYGLIGLFVFLSIPHPLNGAFTASLVAFILGFPMHKALPYLFAGVLVGNSLTLALVLGAVRIF